MLKYLPLLACALIVCSGQTCGININPIQRVPLNDADAEVTISRDSVDNDARVVAEITRGLALVRLEEDQNVAANDTDLIGDRGDYRATIDADDSYEIAVTDPRRGTDRTTIDEPGAFVISAPSANGNASLSGFTVTWTNPDANLEVEVRVTQRLFGEDLSLTLDRAPDTGSATISSRKIADAGFGQGRKMTITVTKIRTNTNLRGFRDGVLSCRLSNSVEVNPAP